MKIPTELEKVEELILDYALDNNMYRVIQAFTANKGPAFFLEQRGSIIPDVRMFSATINAIVKHEEVQHFHKVIRMLTLMHEEQPEAVSLRRFSQIMLVLKIKALIFDISKEAQFSKLFSKLDEYFPTTPTNAIKKHATAVIACRKILRAMIVSRPEERIHIKESLEKKYDKKYMQTFLAQVSNLLRKFKTCLPVPILQQVTEEVESSQTFHNMALSTTSLLDTLISTCFQNPPSEDMLLTMLDNVWSTESSSSQQTVGCSQVFSFLCSSTFMASQFSQEGDTVGQLASQPVASQTAVSNDSSGTVISPSLKTSNDVSDKASGDVLDSSESSKSVTLLRNPSGVGSTQDHRTDVKEYEYFDPDKEEGSVNTYSNELEGHEHDNHDESDNTCNDGNYELQINDRTEDRPASNQQLETQTSVLPASDRRPNPETEILTSSQSSVFLILSDGTDHASQQPVKLFLTPADVTMSSIVDRLYEILELCTLDGNEHPLDNPELSGRVTGANRQSDNKGQSMFEFFNSDTEENMNDTPSSDDSQVESGQSSSTQCIIAKDVNKESEKGHHTLASDTPVEQDTRVTNDKSCSSDNHVEPILSNATLSPTVNNALTDDITIVASHHSNQRGTKNQNDNHNDSEIIKRRRQSPGGLSDLGQTKGHFWSAGRWTDEFEMISRELDITNLDTLHSRFSPTCTSTQQSEDIEGVVDSQGYEADQGETADTGSEDMSF